MPVRKRGSFESSTAWRSVVPSAFFRIRVSGGGTGGPVKAFTATRGTSAGATP